MGIFSHHVQIKNLSIMIENKELFQNANLCLKTGDILIIQGDNGSGKSTVLKSIVGLSELDPSKGNKQIYSFEILLSTKEFIHPHLHYFSSDHGSRHTLKGDISLIDHLLYWISLYNVERFISYETLLTYLELVDLQNHSYKVVESLSLGQRKRLLILKYLICLRPFWIMDEVSIGLDRDWISYLERLLIYHRSQGGIVLLATHMNLKIPHSTVLKFS